MTGYVTLHDAYFVLACVILMIFMVMSAVGYVKGLVKSLEKRVNDLESLNRHEYIMTKSTIRRLMQAINEHIDPEATIEVVELTPKKPVRK